MPRMGDLAATDAYNAFDVPGEQTYDRRLDQTWPGKLVQEAMGAVLAPGRALQSTEPITTEQMIKPAADLAGLVTGGSYAAPAQRGASGAGIRAYHSSPHDFDKFDLAKIGSGEGAQVYGHGLYFAENPAVSGQGGEYWKQFARRFQGPDTDPAVVHAVQMLEASGGDRAKALAKGEAALKGDYRATTLPDAVALLRSDKPVGPRTYEVNINADPAYMLNWDKALAQQHPRVTEAIRHAYKKAGVDVGDEFLRATDLAGHDAYGSIGRSISPGSGYKASSPVTSQYLQEAGIPGIKYLDEGSRGHAGQIARAEAAIRNPANSSTMQGAYQSNLEQLKQTPLTSNYVVFDPGIIDIMKKYGIAGAAPVGMGALAAQDRYEQ